MSEGVTDQKARFMAEDAKKTADSAAELARMAHESAQGAHDAARGAQQLISQLIEDYGRTSRDLSTQMAEQNNRVWKGIEGVRAAQAAHIEKQDARYAEALKQKSAELWKVLILVATALGAVVFAMLKAGG